MSALYSNEALQPYITIGTAYEDIQHLSALEHADEWFGAMKKNKNPEGRIAHGLLLSEMADTLCAIPASADDRADREAKARAALARSDIIYFTHLNAPRGATTSDPLLDITAHKELAFNRLRRGLIAGQVTDLIRPALETMVELVGEVPWAKYSNKKEPPENTRLRSELLSLAALLWATAERPKILGGDRYIIGWPSYVRQRRAPAPGAYSDIGPESHRAIPKNPNFDIRLSTYGREGAERVQERKKIHIRSGGPPYDTYAPDIYVVPMAKVSRGGTPQDVRALAADMDQPYKGLHLQRQKRVGEFIHKFLQEIGVMPRRYNNGAKK